MKYYKRIFKLVLFLIVILVVSCKKDDNVKPRVAIVKPTSDYGYNCGDTIWIKASISDDNLISNVQIKVLDENNVTVLPTFQIEVNKASYELSTYVVIDNKDLESGTYFLKIIAKDDEDGEGSQLRSIHITALSRVFKNMILFCKSANTHNIIKLNQSGSETILKHLDNEFVYSAVSSKNDLIAYSGALTSNLNTINTNDASEKWTVNNEGSSVMPYFSGIYTNEYYTYVMLYAGLVREYDKAGTLRRTFDIGSSFRPVQVLRHDDKLVVLSASKINSPNSLFVMNFGTCNISQTKVFSDTPVKLISRNANEIIVFTNQGNTGVLNIFKYDEGDWWQPHALSGKFLDATQIDENNYIIVTSLGCYWYSYQNNSVTPFGPALASNVVYEDISSQVVFVKDNKVELYTFPSNHKAGEFMLNDTIESVYLLYNR